MANSVEAEIALLSCLLKNHELLGEVSDRIKVTDFSDIRNQEFYSLLLTFEGAFDSITVTNVANDKMLVHCGTIIRYYATSASLWNYVEIIEESSKERHLKQSIAELSKDELKIDEKIKNVETILGELSKQKGRGLVHVSEYLPNIVDKLEKRLAGIYEDKISTGYPDLDKICGGFSGGDLIIIAGRPSMGKTALALNMAERMCISGGQPIAFFSLEMSNQQISERLICSLGRINTNIMRDGNLSGDDYTRLTKSMTLLKQSCFHMDDTPDWSIQKIRTAFRRAQRKGAKCIFFDYLQLVSDGSANRVNFISDLTRNLKLAAKELNIPVVALSQLSRNLEQRQNKRPLMSDLRESGSIEQDADMVLFVYRDEVYNKNSEMKGITEVICGKNRAGEVRDVLLTSMLQFCRFEDHTGERPRIADKIKYSRGME